MISLCKSLLIANEVFDMDKKLKEIDEVTIDAVNNFAAVTFNARPALAYVGNDSGVDFEQYLGR